ncbi:MAG: M18 family aminopeptidase [Nocardioidaceae bacterium]|nr:M18 family aminopeptidase [Nocardioidaceae bacterium]
MPHPAANPATAENLATFVDASPSPFHVCATVAAALETAGFARLDEGDAFPTEAGRHYLVRGGSLVAWSTTSAAGPTTPFRVLAGHTDSPNLRLKQHPDRRREGWRTVALEPYGGAHLNSWLDRDLGISGRVTVRDGGGATTLLVHVDEPVLRVPQLAIHLSEDRKGVTLDPQRHVDAIWGLDTGHGSVLDLVAGSVGREAGDLLNWELMTHDTAPSRVVGVDHDLLSAPRLDNQGTCFTGLQALLHAADQPDSGVVPVLALFDHEEVGSQSDRGASGRLLVTVLERVVLAAGGAREDLHRALAGSVVASGDMAHATHPGYAERHEPGHHIAAGGGPVLKVNQNLRYATDAGSGAVFALACEQAGVPLQRYVHRADLPCGSTVGPMTAAQTGVSTVDVGAPQLAMHAARELMAAADVPLYAAALGAFLAPAR